jgi:hypothetical protein
MSRDLGDELVETLRERADSVPDVPTLAGAALARGRALRRRRRIAAAVAPAVAAVVVVTAATALTGGVRADGPPRPARTPTVTAAQGYPPRPYVFKVPEGSGPGIFHVVTKSASALLPEGDSVMRIFRAGDDVVAEVLGPDGQSVVVVSADGRVRTLPGLKPPVVVSRDGTQMLGMAPDAPGGPRLMLVALPSGEEIWSLPGERVPLGFVLLPPVLDVLSAENGRLGTWDLAGQKTREVPNVRFDDDAALSAAPDGRRVLIVDQRELRAVDVQGRTLWTRSLQDTANGVYTWSPDATRVVLSTGGRLEVVAAADGRTLARSAKQPFDLVGLRWLDARHVVGREHEPGTGRAGERWVSCDVATGACEPYRRRQALLPDS